jgi:hypothetical protein
MSARAAAWLAWITWALSIVLTVLSLWLLILNLSHPNVPLYLYWAEDTLLAVGYSTLGAVAASHRPGNPVGWVLCSIGLSWGVAHFTSEYATYALLAAPGSLPAAEAAAWIYSWVWVPGLGFLCCSPVVGCLLLAGVHSPGSAYCWRGRERLWRRSLRDRALVLASGILSGWRTYRTSLSSFRRSCSP